MIFRHYCAHTRHKRGVRPLVQTIKTDAFDDLWIVRGKVAHQLERLVGIALGVCILGDDRRFQKAGLRRNVTDLVLVDLERELFVFGQREKCGDRVESAADQILRDAVAGQIVKADLLLGMAHLVSESLQRAGVAVETGGGVENGYFI